MNMSDILYGSEMGLDPEMAAGGPMPPVLPQLGGLGPHAPTGPTLTDLLAQYATLSRTAEAGPQILTPQPRSGIEKVLTFAAPLVNAYAQSAAIRNWRRRRAAFFGGLASGGVETALSEAARPRLIKESVAQQQKAGEEERFGRLSKMLGVGAELERAQNAGLPNTYQDLLARRAAQGDKAAEAELEKLAAGVGQENMLVPGMGIYRVGRTGPAQPVVTETPGAEGGPPAINPLIPPAKTPRPLSQTVRDKSGRERTIYTNPDTGQSWTVGAGGQKIAYTGEPVREPRLVRPTKPTQPKRGTPAQFANLEKWKSGELQKAESDFRNPAKSEYGDPDALERRKQAVQSAYDQQQVSLGGAAGEGKTLDQATALQILREAGGNKDRARQIAKQRGYKF